jgi:primosomal protein N' (replication factor Y)
MLFNKHIPRTPIVAMILADTLLHLPDFRSNERTYQLISQLKNLASENFILQTYSPENPAIVSAVNNDYNSFYKEEIETRKILSYPPFSQLIKLVYAHQSPKRAEDEAKILSEKLKQQVKIFSKELTGINKKTEAVNLQPFAILGPSSAFISKVSGRYIWQIIIKSKISDCKLRNKILQIIPRGWIVDADPLQII